MYEYFPSPHSPLYLEETSEVRLLIFSMSQFDINVFKMLMFAI